MSTATLPSIRRNTSAETTEDTVTPETLIPTAIARVVALAPPFTAAQRERIAAAFANRTPRTSRDLPSETRTAA
jgi:hypothetical protein